MGLVRRAVAFVCVTAALTSCSGSGQSSNEVSFVGKTAAGSFDATIGYPSSAHAGATIAIPMVFKNTGGRVASFQFDIAVDGPPQCHIINMMTWRDVEGDVRPGAEAAVLRYNRLPRNTDLRELGLWPGSGFNLRNGEDARTSRTFELPPACRGNVDFVAVAKPYGRAAIIRRLRIAVT